MKNYSLSAMFVMLGMVSQGAFAFALNDNFEVLGEAGLYSEYASRGLSLTDRNPALQGSLTLVHTSGLYAGVWGSNVDVAIADTRMETDYYGGYLWQIQKDISLDVGYLRYTYPKSSFLNTSETYAKLNAYGYKIGTYYSNDGGGSNAYMYTYVGYETKALPYDIGLDLKYGYADYKDPTFFSADGSSKSAYTTWEVALSKKLFGLNWSASYIDTNLSKSECSSYLADDKSCSARLVVGVAKQF